MRQDRHTRRCLRAAALAGLLGLLCGCLDGGSVSTVTPNSAVGAVTATEEPARTSRSEAERAVAESEAAARAAAEADSGTTVIPAEEFVAAFALQRASVLSALRKAARETEEAAEDAPETAGDEVYAREADTTALCALCEDGSYAVLAGNTLLLADEEGSRVLGTLSSLLPEEAEGEACFLSETAGTVILGTDGLSGKGTPVTRLSFFSLDEELRTTVTVDGRFVSGTLGEEGLVLVTSFWPESGAARLPSMTEAGEIRDFLPSEILSPGEWNAPCFTLCTVWDPETGSCVRRAAAGGDCEVLPFSDGVLFLWTDTARSTLLRQESVYDVTEITLRARTGAALLTAEEEGFGLAALGSVDGACAAAYAAEEGFCLVTGTGESTQTTYRDEAYDLTVSGEWETAEGDCMLLLLDRDLEETGRVVLAEGEMPTLLGLWDTKLYYITASDGLLRTAGIADSTLPIAAPLAEVGEFCDLAILAEGYALGLVPTGDGGTEPVLMNVTNPSHITRKVLSGGDPDLPEGTRILEVGAGIDDLFPVLCTGTELILLRAGAAGLSLRGTLTVEGEIARCAGRGSDCFFGPDGGVVVPR